MIYTGFMQFNMNFPTALGFNLGTQCFTSLFSGLFNNYSYQTNPFTFNTPNYFSSAGFDTFTPSNGNFMFNNVGVGFNNFGFAGNWNFSPIFDLTPIWDFNTAQNSNNTLKTKKGKGKVTNGTHIYATLTRKQALAKAKSDSNLEELKGGKQWKLDEDSFTNDIPFAKKGTSKLLDKVCDEAGVSLKITSALGTSTSPHQKGKGSESHYNEKNPKLDFGGSLNKNQADNLAKKLKETGLFSRINVEKNADSNTYHLDVQFSDDAYKTI